MVDKFSILGLANIFSIDEGKGREGKVYRIELWCPGKLPIVMEFPTHLLWIFVLDVTRVKRRKLYSDRHIAMVSYSTIKISARFIGE